MDAATGLMNSKTSQGFKYFSAFLRFLTTTDNLKIMQGLRIRGDGEVGKNSYHLFNIYTVNDLRKRMATTPTGWKLRSTSD